MFNISQMQSMQPVYSPQGDWYRRPSENYEGKLQKKITTIIGGEMWKNWYWECHISAGEDLEKKSSVISFQPSFPLLWRIWEYADFKIIEFLLANSKKKLDKKSPFRKIFEIETVSQQNSRGEHQNCQICLKSANWSKIFQNWGENANRCKKPLVFPFSLAIHLRNSFAVMRKKEERGKLCKRNCGMWRKR